MSGIELIFRIFSGIFLLSLNGIFVMTEFALTRLRQHDESEFRDGGTLELAWDMTGELEIYLTACQLGITITSILLGVVFEPAITELIFPLVELIGLTANQTSFLAIGIAVVLIQFMHTVWGEQSPTYLGVERPKQVAGVFAPILYGWTWACYPVIYLGDHMAKWTLGLFNVELTRSWTEDEGKDQPITDLRGQIGELLARGELSEERREEVLNALEIGQITTREIMVNRDSIRAVSTERSLEENLEAMGQSGFSRFPLIGESLDEYRGIIYVPGILSSLDGIKAGEITLEDLAFEVMTVSPELSVSDLVDRFQEEGHELALVVEDERVVGLVTTTDASEAIIGELRDPYD
jgi:CBS domain containing-hemolysin-like protein